MPLETATYIDDLVTANPADTDNESQGAAHLRLIKSCLKASFPSLGSAAVNATAAQLNAIQSAIVGSGTTLNVQNVNGGVPMGTIHMFARDPGTTLCARGGTATGNEQFVLLDGATYAQSKFAALGASAFVTISAPNFTVDNLCDTGRFIRAHVPGTTTPGTKQANQNAAHAHGITDPGHGHTENAHSHGVTDPGHNHTLPGQDTASGPTTGFGIIQQSNPGAQGLIAPSVSTNTTGISINSATATINANTTGISVNSAGGAEARPEAYIAFICIKT